MSNKLSRIRAKIMYKEAPSSSSLFSSLPDHIVLNVLARVPRRYHRNLSLVSKELRCLVRSPEFHKTRSLMGKDCFYVCFEEYVYPRKINHWFTLDENRRRLVSVPFPSPPEPYSNALMVGPEIYFVGGCCTHPSSSMWILDTRSGKLRRGPSSLVTSGYAAAGLVNDKIFLFGGRCEDEYYEEIKAQAFDLKTETWQVAPNPSMSVQSVSMSATLGNRMFSRNAEEVLTVYDTRDGETEKLAQQINSKDLCVVDNVLYIYHYRAGLLWYDSKEKEWRVVHGLKLSGHICWDVALAEYNGKLAFMWHERKKSEVWCSMIALYGSSKVAIRGRVQWSSCLLSDVPFSRKFRHYICQD